MKAEVLVDVLLELNVINTQDIDREINRLAARIVDPRAAKWFRRVPRYFVINVDKMINEPYVAKAEPRGLRSAKYNYRPTGGWEPGQGPSEPEDKSKWWSEKPYAGDPQKCPRCGGIGLLWKTPSGQAFSYDPEHPPAAGAAFKCKHCNGTGQNISKGGTGGTGFYPESLDEQYDPIERTYTSNLHQPLAQKHLTQNFAPFKPGKAKSRSFFGAPPAKKDLQPWMTAPEAKAKEFHHFDPINVRRRDLFSRLNDLTNYLNWQAHIKLVRAKSENANERAQAEAAEALFQRLATMKTEDINGFREIMSKAEEFASDVSEKPWLYSNDGKVIATHGSLTLRKAVLPKTATAMSCKKTANGRPPTVCTNNIGNAEDYLETAPIYFVDKNDLTVAVCHFTSGQVHDPQNHTLDDPTSLMIAPLFVSRPIEFPIGLLARGDEVMAAEVDRLRKQAKVR